MGLWQVSGTAPSKTETIVSTRKAGLVGPREHRTFSNEVPGLLVKGPISLWERQVRLTHQKTNKTNTPRFKYFLFNCEEVKQLLETVVKTEAPAQR